MSDHLKKSEILSTRPNPLRRDFFRQIASTTASLAGSQIAVSANQPSTPPSRKIKLGWVGCGNRGSALLKLFRQHGGFQIHAIADYFQDEVDRWGEVLEVDKSRRFSGLSGCTKVLESGVEALGILDIPYFHPEHAQAAVAANCHVYLAKPIAVDTWGCRTIEAAGQLATSKNRCFFVDYQLSTAPPNIEVAKRIWDGGLGSLLAVTTIGTGGGRRFNPDPPKGRTIESRLRKGIWTSDIALGGDRIVEFDIHCIHGAVWAIRRRAQAAVGYLQIRRPNPQSDFHDLGFITYECADGLLWNHQTICAPDHGSRLVCNIHGTEASAQINYQGKSFIRGGAQEYMSQEIGNQFTESAIRAIAAFYQAVIEGKCDNSTVQPSVDATLTAILGREAAARGRRLTMDELLAENQRIQVDLSALKV